MLNLPSPVQKIKWKLADEAGVEVWIKRDDLIHPIISGNKWRKLLYNVKEVQENKLRGIITFGGAFSNHIVATAHAGFVNNIETVGVIRGEEADFENPTLSIALENGMKLEPVSREKYKLKSDSAYILDLQKKYPGFLLVPEGGANVNGVKGCMEILNETNEKFTTICCPIGSATTFSGLVSSATTEKKVIGFSALKGGGYLRADVDNFLSDLSKTENTHPNFAPSLQWRIEERFHFGGFAKMKEPLVRFMNDFWNETGVPLDPVYTGKMIFGLAEMIKNQELVNGERVLVIHTGGLQGIAGMNKKLSNKNYNIEYENKF